MLKVALAAPRRRVDSKFEFQVRKMVSNIQMLHNRNLEKHRSVFTDSYSMRPYLLDSELGRQKRQPKFVTTDDVITIEKIAHAILTDRATYAMRSSSLQSCGGFRCHLIWYRTHSRMKSNIIITD